MRVLLVDDEEKFADMLAKRLSLRGIEADCVHSGEAALEKVRRQSYDVGILDVKMPGIGGIALKRELSRLAPEMKFVFLTGHGSKNDFEAGSAEAAFYLTKPLQIEELLAVLNQLAG